MQSTLFHRCSYVRHLVIPDRVLAMAGSVLVLPLKASLQNAAWSSFRRSWDRKQVCMFEGRPETLGFLFTTWIRTEPRVPSGSSTGLQLSTPIMPAALRRSHRSPSGRSISDSLPSPRTFPQSLSWMQTRRRARLLWNSGSWHKVWGGLGKTEAFLVPNLLSALIDMEENSESVCLQLNFTRGHDCSSESRLNV